MIFSIFLLLRLEAKFLFHELIFFKLEKPPQDKALI